MSAVSMKSLVLVGHGAVAGDWLEAAASCPSSSSTRSSNRSPSAARPSQARGVRVFESVAELLSERSAPDVAVLCTPPAVRLETAEPLLRAGADVLIEPPLATVPHEADRIAEVAERLDRVALTISRFRAEPALRVTLERIARRRHRPAVRGRGGALPPSAMRAPAGAAIPRSRAAACCSSWAATRSSSPKRSRARCSAFACSRARACRARTSRTRSTSRPITAVGCCANVWLSWNQADARPIARCIGDRGEIAIGWAQTSLVREDGGREVIAGPRDEHAARVAVLQEFLRERRSAERRIDAGPQSLAWLHAAYRSAASRRFELA